MIFITCQFFHHLSIVRKYWAILCKKIQINFVTCKMQFIHIFFKKCILFCNLFICIIFHTTFYSFKKSKSTLTLVNCNLFILFSKMYPPWQSLYMHHLSHCDCWFFLSLQHCIITTFTVSVFWYSPIWMQCTTIALCCQCDTSTLEFVIVWIFERAPNPCLGWLFPWLYLTLLLFSVNYRCECSNAQITVMTISC